MALRDTLEQLGEPDPTAIDRIWSRYERSRSPTRWVRWIAPPVVLAAAAAAVFALAPESEQHLIIDAPVDHTWSDQVSFSAQGLGTVKGTSQDLEIEWQSGTFRAEVVPHTGTEVTVITAEATVEVVGTVFSVDRDRLGSTVDVERGRVKVSCADGWSGYVSGDSPAHTCLPTTPALLLGRADALIDAGARDETLLRTLDLGIDAAEDGPIRGELLARRMRVHAEADRIDAALQDADTYLDTRAPSRSAEVRRFAGWLALSKRGCTEATPWLSALGDTAEPRDTVLLAECIAVTEPHRARQMLRDVRPGLDAEWRARVDDDLAALSEER